MKPHTRVCLIDDDEEIGDIVNMALEPGYEITQFFDSEEAAQVLTNGGYDVYLLDHDLGDVTIFEVLSENGFSNDGPLILITQNENPEIEKTAMEYGITNFLLKQYIFEAYARRLLTMIISYSIQNHRASEHNRKLTVSLHGLLHNMGNILNSVRILVENEVSDYEKTTGLDLRRMEKALDMIVPYIEDGNGDALASYLLEHPKGRLLIRYLVETVKNENQLHQENHSVNMELKRKINDMKDILEDQKNRTNNTHFLQEFDLALLIGYIVSDFRKTYENRNLVIEWVHPEAALIISNPVTVKQIARNLVKNAIEAMHGQPENRLRIVLGDAKDGLYTLTFTDNGCGIPEEYLERIFSYQFSTKKGNPAGHGGQGVGLNMVKEQVRELGGSILAQSDGPGTGATFVLKIPIHHPSSVAPVG